MKNKKIEMWKKEEGGKEKGSVMELTVMNTFFFPCWFTLTGFKISKDFDFYEYDKTYICIYIFI